MDIMLCNNHQRSNFKKQSGMTLVEVLIGMAIMLVLMLPIAGIIKTSFQSYRYNMAQNYNLSQAQVAINTITDELRYAKSPILNNSGTVIDYVQTVKVNSVDMQQACRMYIGDGSSSNTPKNALIVEHTDPQTKQKSYKSVAQGMFISNASTPIFTLDTTTKIMYISISVNDHSYDTSPTETLSTSFTMTNL